jgi:hypothetical protein
MGCKSHEGVLIKDRSHMKMEERWEPRGYKPWNALGLQELERQGGSSPGAFRQSTALWKPWFLEL